MRFRYGVDASQAENLKRTMLHVVPDADDSDEFCIPPDSVMVCRTVAPPGASDKPADIWTVEWVIYCGFSDVDEMRRHCVCCTLKPMVEQGRR